MYRNVLNTYMQIVATPSTSSFQTWIRNSQNRISQQSFHIFPHSSKALPLFPLTMKASAQAWFDFTSVLWAPFTRADPKSAKRHWWLDCLFACLGSEHVKALRKHVGEIDPLSVTQTQYVVAVIRSSAWQRYL